MSNNNLLLAVAGSGKTRGIVEECASFPVDERILILTYTANNQRELVTQLARYAGTHCSIEVMGWFSFLLRRFVRPFLPYSFPGKRLQGFDFKSEPQTGTTLESFHRYFNNSGQARRVHLPQLATRIDKASEGAAIRTICRIYDRIYIDEVQDLCGYDLEILKLLMAADIPMKAVGDVRQAVIATNPREAKNKKYMFMGIWTWFKEQEAEGALQIEQQCETKRCRIEIARFADALFDSSWGFESTISLNTATTDHDGIYLVREEHVPSYIDVHEPLFLRSTANSARNRDFDFMNFRISKGLTRNRVLVWPTAAIKSLIQKGAPLQQSQASDLYVAVTRASQSVAFVVDDPGQSDISIWSPEEEPCTEQS